MLNKQRVKSLLFGSEMRITAIISNGLAYKLSRKTMLKAISKEIGALGRSISLNKAEIDLLWANSVRRLDKIARNSVIALKRTENNYKEFLPQRREEIYKVVKRELNFLEREKNVLADQIEERVKARTLDDMLGDGIFYLCSAHTNPAPDHADYEGKIYVSEEWEYRIEDSELLKKVERFIKNKHILTIEEVVYDKPYLITRPNCKHFLIPISTEEALRSSARSLLKRKGAIVENNREITYVKAQYNTYYDRWKSMSELNKLCPSNQLQNDIRRARGKMRKWASVLKRIENNKAKAG